MSRSVEYLNSRSVLRIILRWQRHSSQCTEYRVECLNLAVREATMLISMHANQRMIQHRSVLQRADPNPASVRYQYQRVHYT